MNRMTLNSLFVFVLTLFVASVSSEPELTAENFATSINNFSCNFLKQLNYGSENIVFSPLSISMAMGMVLKGAKGATADEIYGLFNLNGYSNKEKIHNYLTDIMRDQKLNHHVKGPSFRYISIELANLVLIAKNFSVEDAFKTAMKDEYFALIGSEDFIRNGSKIMEKVNTFVKERTHELIPKVLKEPLKPDTLLFLLNSIYFEAYSTHRPSTFKSTFYNFDKTNSTVDFMSEEMQRYRFFNDNKQNILVLEVDYLGNASMILVLPRERYGLQRVVNSVSCGAIENMLASGRSSTLPVQLPKFKFAFEADLKKILPGMGVSSIFNRPDLSGIARDIKVSHAKYKTIISVDAGDTEAAAITSLRIKTESLPFTWFVADEPFLFFIRDQRTGINLFAGVVNKL